MLTRLYQLSLSLSLSLSISISPPGPSSKRRVGLYWQCNDNVTWWRVRITIVAVERR
jgi:hypothetical protein